MSFDDDTATMEEGTNGGTAAATETATATEVVEPVVVEDADEAAQAR